MAKKIRSGLQSEISHIFAGVPVPKKRHPDHSKEKPVSPEPEQTPAEQVPDDELTDQQTTEKTPTLPEKPLEQPPVPESLVEQPPVDEPAVEQLPEEQPSLSEASLEQQPVTEPSAEEPSAPEPPVEHVKFEAPLIEPVVVPKPQMEEPSDEQSSASFDQTIELPEVEEPLEKPRKLSSASPAKVSVAEQNTIVSSSKVLLSKKQKRIPRIKPKAGVNSRRQTTMIVLVISLSILLFFLLVKPFDKPSRRSRSSRGNQTAASELPVAAGVGKVVIDWSAPDTYPAEIRDPMLLSSQQQYYSKTWKPNLVGIVYNEKQKYAIIGTQIVEEGFEINGVKVVKINRDSVEFQRDNQKWKQEVRRDDN